MNKKAQLVERIKAQLKSIMQTKLAQHMAGDLIIVTEEDMISIDSEVFTQDEEGNNVPLQDGDYNLDSGEIISVLNGKVVSIKKEEVEEVIEPEVELEVVVEEVVVEEVTEVDEFKKKLKDLEDKVEMLLKKFEDSEKEKEEMKKKFSEIAEQPSTVKIEKRPVELSSDKTAIDIDFKSMRDNIRKNQK